MALAVLRIAPVKQSALRSMAKHHGRQHSKTDEHVDPDRSDMNKVLEGTGDPALDVEAMASNYRLAKTTDDPTLACEVILTAGREYFDREFPRWREDPDTLKPWIDANLSYLRDNPDTMGTLASATLHLDEDAPHIHAVTVPIADVRIKNRNVDRVERRISYSQIFGDSKATLAEARRNGTVATDTKLGRMQTAYAEHLQRAGLHLERGSSNTGRKHISPRKYRDIIAFERPNVETQPINTIIQPKNPKTIKERLKAAQDIIVNGDKAQILKEHKNTEHLLAQEAIKRGKMIPDAFKVEALENENRNLKIEVELLQDRIKSLSEKQQAIAEELRQNKELMKEYRGLDEFALIREKYATKDEIERFKEQSGRTKFNAIDFTKWRDNCDFPTAIYTLAETFNNEEVARTAAEKHVEDHARPEMQKATEQAAKIEKTLDKVDSDLSIIIPKRATQTPAQQMKERAIIAETDAIGAQLYRVTLMSKDPTQPTFNLGKGRDGEPEKFYTAQELVDLIPTLSYRNAKGYNIFITPIPDEERRFILLDDIKDLDKARAMKPALILQTSPKSKQALYIVDGNTPEHAARHVFNNINRENGDHKISGLVHPMRLAGFTNRKPAYEDNGKFPFVQIVEATGQKSDVLSDFIFKVAMEKEEELERMPTIKSKPKKEQIMVHSGFGSRHTQQPNITMGGDLNDIKDWYKRQTEYWGDKTDYSRIDRRLCTAMANAGYTEDEAKAALLAASPNILERHPDIDRYLASKTKDLDFDKKSDDESTNNATLRYTSDDYDMQM